MTCGIYKITNKINGKFYIGQSMRIEERFQGHMRGVGHCPILTNAVRKCGRENFSLRILVECNKNQLDKLEQYWIDKLHPGYNIAPVVSSVKGIKWSVKSRKKLSSILKGRTVPKEQVERMRITQRTSMLGNKNGMGNKGRVGHSLTKEHQASLLAGHRKYWRDKRRKSK